MATLFRELQVGMQIPPGTYYELYYDPAFEFDAPGVDTDPNPVSNDAGVIAKLAYMRRRIPKIAKSIERQGLINPLYVEIRPEGTKVHPGQTRCRALRRLGMTTAPALIVDLVGNYEGQSISPCEAMRLFTDDMKLTISEDGRLRMSTISPLFEGETQDKAMTISHA